MASLRFTSFGAATVPLSKIVIDRTLDMGDYPLVGQMVMAPYRPYTWDTVPFQYDDKSPTTLQEGGRTSIPYANEPFVATWTNDTPNACYVRGIATVTDTGFSNPARKVEIAVNEDIVYTSGELKRGETRITDAAAVFPDDVFELIVTAASSGSTVLDNWAVVKTGHQVPYNLDLQGRFLALEQDFGDLTATLTFGNEVDVPLSDYPNRFPYAPDKITLGRHNLENRPVINIYKGV